MKLCILIPTSCDAKKGAVVMAWILVLFHPIAILQVRTSISHQSLDENLWKFLGEALHSNIMVSNKYGI